MGSGKIVRIFFALLFIVIAFVSGWNYFEYRKALANGQPVQYGYVDRKIKKGKGRTHEMTVSYKGKVYVVDIEGDMYYDVDTGKYPPMYYVASRDKLITAWYVTFSLRLMCIFSGLFIVCILPWDRWMAKWNNPQSLKKK